MTAFYHEIKLPGLTIPGNIFLAPIAGFSDAPFRRIATEMGADMTFSEMVSCDGLVYNGEKTVALMERSPVEKFFAVQLFTAKPEMAYNAVPAVLPFSPEMIDLNCGCPVPKVVKNGAGSALMNDQGLLREIVSAIVSALKEKGLEIPVSVKIRSGWDNDSINYLETARTATDAGASMITLHPRTRSQGYSGKADWEKIRILKSESEVPVIGSGDLFSPEDALRMLESTGCDGLMFSRGSFGNPWIFRRTRELLTGRPCSALPTEEERKATALDHLESAAGCHGEERACKEMKKHLCSYIKGIQGASEIRNKIVHAATVEDYRAILSGK